MKKNGKHRLHKAGKVDVSVDVSNGKVVGLTAAHPTEGNLQVRKVCRGKSWQTRNQR